MAFFVTHFHLGIAASIAARRSQRRRLSQKREAPSVDFHLAGLFLIRVSPGWRGKLRNDWCQQIELGSARRRSSLRGRARSKPCRADGSGSHANCGPGVDPGSCGGVLFARSGCHRIGQHVRHEAASVVQSQRPRSVQGRVHQMRPRKHDDLLDLLHVEGSALSPRYVAGFAPRVRSRRYRR